MHVEMCWANLHGVLHGIKFYEISKNFAKLARVMYIFCCAQDFRDF